MSFIKNYLQNSFRELHMVTWPTRKAAIRITIIVFIFTIISAVVLGLVDQGLTMLYQLFI